jgi:aminoglycoside 6'-N-acetyltransferase
VNIIVGEKVQLRPVTAADAAQLSTILSHPDVAQWWGEPDDAQLHEALDPPEGTSSFAIEFEETTVGLIQATEELEPMYRHAGIDIAIHPDAIRTLAWHLVHARGHHRLTIDPAAHNEAAIRVYRRVGFRPVGIMRKYERGRDGSWHDGLLMDMLAEELTEPGGRALIISRTPVTSKNAMCLDMPAEAI